MRDHRHLLNATNALRDRAWDKAKTERAKGNEAFAIVLMNAAYNEALAMTEAADRAADEKALKAYKGIAEAANPNNHGPEAITGIKEEIDSIAESLGYSPNVGTHVPERTQTASSIPANAMDDDEQRHMKELIDLRKNEARDLAHKIKKDFPRLIPEVIAIGRTLQTQRGANSGDEASYLKTAIDKIKALLIQEEATQPEDTAAPEAVSSRDSSPGIFSTVSRDSSLKNGDPETIEKPTGNKAFSDVTSSPKSDTSLHENTSKVVIGLPLPLLTTPSIPHHKTIAPEPSPSSSGAKKSRRRSAHSSEAKPSQSDLNEKQVQHLGMARHAWKHTGRPLNVSLTININALTAYCRTHSKTRSVAKARSAGCDTLSQFRRDMRKQGFPMTFIAVFEQINGAPLHTHEMHHFQSIQQARDFIPHLARLFDADLDISRLLSDPDYAADLRQHRRIPFWLEGANHQGILTHTTAALMTPKDAGFPLSYMAKSAPNCLTATAIKPEDGEIITTDLGNLRHDAAKKESAQIRQYQPQSADMTITKRIISSADMTRPHLLSLGIKPEDAGWLFHPERNRRDDPRTPYLTAAEEPIFATTKPASEPISSPPEPLKEWRKTAVCSIITA